MKQIAPNGRAFALTATLVALAFAATPLAAQDRGRDEGRVRDVSLTTNDLSASNEKIAMAYGDLVSMWSKGFQQIGQRFAVPRLLRYRSVAGTPCGIMGPNNAAYCPEANTIFYDELFVASQARSAARDLGTDGDMAAVGIIAHEMGHAVAIQLGYASRFTYDNESVADCLAGAFANHSRRVGSLENGDEEEAFYGMATAGDPTPQLTGDPRWDRRIERRAAVMGHGTRDQRMQNFRTGYEGGAGSCVSELNGVQ